MNARILLATAALALACGGADQPNGAIVGPTRDGTERVAIESAQRMARAALDARSEIAPDPRKRVLFGDLHVHTTYSIDAFLYGLPLFGGEGVHPPADACDFARWCAGLDFFSLNDHAEGLTAPRWRESIDSLRECNERAGDPENPDLVAYVGYEWTQTGTTPDRHFGHKNVIFPGLADDELPARPISALADDVMNRARFLWLARGVEAVLAVGDSPYADFLWWIRRLADTPLCARDVDTRELPSDCQENAPTPAALFAKLAQWGGESLVIPHGLVWGIHAPPGATLATQLTREHHDPERQRLIEVFSGHGAGEVFHPAAARADAAATDGICVEPTPDFLPCCARAGQLVRARCDDPDSAACDARVAEAKRFALEAGTRPHWVLPGTSVEDWLDCDQPRDAFKTALSPRPLVSAQAALAMQHAEETDANGEPLRFRFGWIGSSDIHTARAGSGYKQLGRKGMTDARGFASERGERWLSSFVSGEPDPAGAAVRAPAAEVGFRGLLDVGRSASFLYPGGLVAAHATGRDRRSIWDALQRREVYATSGPRILLWFDLTNGPDGNAPMGSAVVQREVPRFEVRAVGSRVQQPGCPQSAVAALTPERVASLCLGECHFPSDERHRIDAIEVVRITPGADPATLAERIEDPWRHHDCPADGNGCVFHFEDPDFGATDRVYYARALQAPTPAINGANLRTRFDSSATAAMAVEPCHGGWRTDAREDCLAPVHERAWSSPLFLDAPRS